MQPPYDTLFIELAPLLDVLRFAKERDDTFGAAYVRPDGYRLQISIERTGDGFSTDLEKVGSRGMAGHLSSDCLMEAIDPEAAQTALGVTRDCSQQGLLTWWKTYLTFLVKHEKVVFSFPSVESDSLWSAYVRIYRQKMRSMGLNPEEIV
jgi:hypothetical protein